MYSFVFSSLIQGIESRMVQVEADVSDGLPGFSMVGDLSMRVREAQNRVTTAFRNTGIHLIPKRVTVNLAPADIHKDGAGFDLPIAIAVLDAYGLLPAKVPKDLIMIGELNLDGNVRGVRGILPMVQAAKKEGIRTFILPECNRKEGEVIEGIQIVGVLSLAEVLQYLEEPESWTQQKKTYIYIEETVSDDFCHINGQQALKRAAEVAAAGRHNLLMVGPPGAGKTMAARCLPGILPPLSTEESLEISAIYSVAGLLKEGEEILRGRPFRSPHHTITPQALAGGGRIPKPGEISLAHKGVLFLDELPEFQKGTLEILRQPLEEHMIRISRMEGNVVYPADCMLVAAMNPCKCGYYPDMSRCTCTEREVRHYLGRISRPLLDRMDISTEAGRVSFRDLTGNRQNEASKEIRERVEEAWNVQRFRYKNDRILFNSQLDTRGIQKYCMLKPLQVKMLEEAYGRLNLSARGYHRILKVARTIADLDGSQEIEEEHLYEAIAYRNPEKQFWSEEELYD